MITDYLAHKLLHQAWLDANPLRQYRLTHHISQQLASTLVGVHWRAIQGWEKAEFRPRPNRFKTLRRLLGDDIEIRWDSWMAQRPNNIKTNKEETE